MKVNMSYELRGRRIGCYASIPSPTVKDLTCLINHAAWIAERTAPEVKVIES